MAVTLRESTPAEIRSMNRLMAIHELCLRAETPGSLRVVSKGEGVNQHFRGRNAPSKAAELAHQLDDTRSEWHIQTGMGWTVITSNQFHRLTADEFNELIGEKG